jgi:hypothetical protein
MTFMRSKTQKTSKALIISELHWVDKCSWC